MLAERAAAPRGPGWKARWPAARRVLAAAFALLVLALLFNLGRHLDWAGALAAVQALPAATLLPAAALAAGSHALYCTYDLIGRRQTGHVVPRRAVLAVGFISYAFNLNLGSLVGGVAFRYRLYSTLGLGTDVITRVLALSLLTNWLGYVFVGGLVLLLHPPALTPWSAAGLHAIGGVMLLLVCGYLALCAGAGRREWQLRGHRLSLPSARLALLQLALSSLNWLLIAGVIHVLLQQRVEYVTVLGVLLLAAVAGVATHVPAGLGVLEAVFLTLLSPPLPQGELLGTLLAYRVVYYLVPLALASTLYLATRNNVLAAPA